MIQALTSMRFMENLKDTLLSIDDSSFLVISINRKTTGRHSQNEPYRRERVVLVSKSSKCRLCNGRVLTTENTQSTKETLLFNSFLNKHTYQQVRLRRRQMLCRTHSGGRRRRRKENGGRSTTEQRPSKRLFHLTPSTLYIRMIKRRRDLGCSQDGNIVGRTSDR